MADSDSEPESGSESEVGPSDDEEEDGDEGEGDEGADGNGEAWQKLQARVRRGTIKSTKLKSKRDKESGKFVSKNGEARALKEVICRTKCGAVRGKAQG